MTFFYRRFYLQSPFLQILILQICAFLGGSKRSGTRTEHNGAWVTVLSTVFLTVLFPANFNVITSPVISIQSKAPTNNSPLSIRGTESLSHRVHRKDIYISVTGSWIEHKVSVEVTRPPSTLFSVSPGKSQRSRPGGLSFVERRCSSSSSRQATNKRI